MIKTALVALTAFLSLSAFAGTAEIPTKLEVVVAHCSSSEFPMDVNVGKVKKEDKWLRIELVMNPSEAQDDDFTLSREVLIDESNSETASYTAYPHKVEFAKGKAEKENGTYIFYAGSYSVTCSEVASEE